MAQCDVRKEVGTGQSNPLLRTTRIFQFTVLASLIWGLPLTGFSAEPPSSISDWHVGGSIDLSYAIDSNFPDNHLWKSKTTTPNVNEPALNMGGGGTSEKMQPNVHAGAWSSACRKGRTRIASFLPPYQAVGNPCPMLVS